MNQRVRRTARRLVSGVATFVCITGVCAAPAFAAGHRIPVGAAPLDIPAEDCGFPIHVGVVEDKEFIVSTREAADGSVTVRFTGKLILSFTNVDTDKTIVRDVSGPGWATFYTDGSLFFRSQGHSIGYNSPADQQAVGLPGLFFATGNLVGHFAPDLSAQSITISGRVEDGCALLAASG
jgi:hypothetical protein